MQKKSVKQQHYVPRVYLRRFTIDGERLYVYDKIKDEIRGPENIKNVAQERFFYDLPVDTIPSNLDPQAEEKALSELEGQFHIAIEAALRVVEGKGADLHERMLMSWFVAVQIVRTRAYRNQLVEMATTVQEELLNTLMRVVKPEWAEQLKAKVNYDDGAASTLHASHMWDKKLLEQLISGIYHHLWIVGINSTETPLHTSDNPVVMRSHASVDSDTENYNWQDRPGLTVATIEAKLTQPHPLAKGIEIIFPLTPTCALIMLDREHFSYLETRQGQGYFLNEDQIQDFNRLQAEQSERQIFSSKNDLESARAISQSAKSSGIKKGYELDIQIHHQFENLQ